MGASQSSSELLAYSAILTSKVISPSDTTFWSRLWTVPQSFNDVKAILTPQLIRILLDKQPQNLNNLIKLVCIQLHNIIRGNQYLHSVASVKLGNINKQSGSLAAEGVSFIQQNTPQIRNCIFVLTCILSVLAEDPAHVFVKDFMAGGLLPNAQKIMEQRRISLLDKQQKEQKAEIISNQTLNQPNSGNVATSFATPSSAIPPTNSYNNADTTNPPATAASPAAAVSKCPNAALSPQARASALRPALEVKSQPQSGYTPPHARASSPPAHDPEIVEDEQPRGSQQPSIPPHQSQLLNTKEGGPLYEEGEIVEVLWDDNSCWYQARMNYETDNGFYVTVLETNSSHELNSSHLRKLHSNPPDPANIAAVSNALAAQAQLPPPPQIPPEIPAPPSVISEPVPANSPHSANNTSPTVLSTDNTSNISNIPAAAISPRSASSAHSPPVEVDRLLLKMDDWYLSKAQS
jgi:hypothetical protein